MGRPRIVRGSTQNHPLRTAGTLTRVGGCVCTRTVYVKERDRVRGLRPGEAYSNATDSFEWIVPRKIMDLPSRKIKVSI